MNVRDYSDFDESDVATASDIRLALALFAFCFAIGGLLTLLVLSQLGS